MYTKLGARIEPLTPQLVEEFRKLPALPGEREIRNARIARQREWIAGRVYTGTEWATVRDKSTGIVYRANGQHSSKVLANLDGLRFPTRSDGSPLSAIIEEWEMDDVARDGLKVFDCFDNPISARSTSDRMCMVRAAYPNIKHLKASHLTAVVNAVEEYRRTQSNYSPIDARFRGEELLGNQDTQDFALFLAQFASMDTGSFIKLTKAMAVAYGSWLADRATAMTFWSSVFNEDDPDDQSDSRILARELREARIKLKRGDKVRTAATKAWRRYITTTRKKAA